MAAYERVTLNRGGRNSRFDCISKSCSLKIGSPILPMEMHLFV